jgi:DNA-binding MurR/RpiR family transcriptional regulator
LRRIASKAAVPPSSITRFIRRERGLSCHAFDRVAAVVNWELRPRRSA